MTGGHVLGLPVPEGVEQVDLVVPGLGSARRQQGVVHQPTGSRGEHSRDDGDPKFAGQLPHSRGPRAVERLGDLRGRSQE